MHNKTRSEAAEVEKSGKNDRKTVGKLVYVNLKSFERKIRNKNTHRSHKMMLQKYKNMKLNAGPLANKKLQQ